MFQMFKSVHRDFTLVSHSRDPRSINVPIPGCYATTLSLLRSDIPSHEYPGLQYTFPARRVAIEDRDLVPTMPLTCPLRICKLKHSRLRAVWAENIQE